MFLPLGDEPNPRGLPVVTYVLIGLNVAVYLLVTLPFANVRPALDDPVLAEYMSALGPRLSREMALAALQQVSVYDLVVFSYGYRPADPGPLALFTSMFLHGGFLHLFGNMLFLWIYGDNVEHRLGRPRYVAAYLGAGVLATLSHAALNAGSAVPMVGASGAISGVLGFYFVWFPRNRVRLWLMLFPFFMYAPARLVLGLYLVVDNLLPFLVTQGAGGVAYGAHIGGFAVGLGCAWWSERREVRRRPADFDPSPADPSPAPDADPSSVRGLRQLIEAGEYGRAAPAYFHLSAARTARLLMPVDSINFARWLANNGHSDAALVVYQRHLRDYPLGPYDAEAHLGAGLVQLHARNQPTAAYQHLITVLDGDPHPETAAWARRALAEIASRQKFRLPGAQREGPPGR